MNRFSVLLILAVFLFSACSDNPGDPVRSSSPSDAGVTSFAKNDGDVDLKDRYIVVFKNNVDAPDALTEKLITQHGGEVHFRYRAALKGFAATLPPQALEGISRNPNVDFIENDGIVYKGAIQSSPPNWGLDRIDERTLPMDGQYVYNTTGAGVTVYIIDTGIRFDHQEYNGRASSGWDFVDNDNNAYDCDGHGTHVAGTVGGTTVGVAKGVNLVAVRVLNCQGSGTYSGVIAGIDWVTLNHVSPAVANMSLGGGYSSSLNAAVNNSVAAGVVYAVSAGNSNANACNYSPASAASALTVGSTTSSDSRSSFSNYGSCVDIFAPGSGIYSSTMNSTSSYASWSGTSMASPHVAGVAALYLGANPNATPSQVENAIIGNATTGVISNAGTGSPNRLLYSLLTGTPPPGTPPAAPTGLSASAASTSQIDLAWSDNSSDETGFRIERSTDGVNFALLTTVGSNVTSFSNTGLSSGTTYWYRVLAYNGSGSSGYSNTASATTLTPPPPPPPSGALHVDGMNGWSTLSRNNWFGHVTVTVVDANSNPVSGAVVTLDWTGDAVGSTTGVTGTNGQVTITTSKFNKRDLTVYLTVSNLAKTGYTYDPSQNNPANATVTVTKP